MYRFPLKLQTIDTRTNEIGTMEFETQDEFKAYVWTQFKVPGQYDLSNTDFWKQQNSTYEQYGYFTPHVKHTPQWERYWIAEKQKVLNGVIIDGFYIPGVYYFYLNFLRIFNKKEKRLTAPNVWDSDYHFFLYIALCVLEGKHAIVVKTRQRGYSYKIAAILYWSYCWYEASINTIGASDESYVKKTWEYIDVYRDFINDKTAWRRGPQIPKALDWVERTMTEDGTGYGLNSKLRGVTFKQSPSKGVGGAQSFFFYEEAGIAPTLLKTIQYIKPAIEAGDTTTGTIIISGSVGELDDCQDLKRIFEDPETYNFLAVDNIYDEKAEYSKCGLFVPDTWSLEGFIDSDGNSNIQAAKAYILAKREATQQGSMAREAYQLALSQNPITPAEAFAFRKSSYFPQDIIMKKQERLPIEKPEMTPVILFEKEDGSVGWRKVTDNDGVKPIVTYPLKDKDDKRGCVVLHELPQPGAPFLTYFAGVDPVATDKTTTSESLFSIYIFKNLTETKFDDEDGNMHTKITGYKPVAWYTGRYDDLRQTNTVAELLLRLYNAKALVESNVQNFINHMQAKNLHRLMFAKDEVGFLEDLRANLNVHKQYGVHMSPTIKEYVLQNIKEYVSEEIDMLRKADGEVYRTIYGVERINDVALLEEIKQWHEKLNTDRVIAFGLALSIAKFYMVNGIFNRVNDVKYTEPEQYAKPTRSFFKNVDGMLNVKKTNKSFFKYHN